MGRRRTAALSGGIVVLGAAAAAVVWLTGGGGDGHGRKVDTAAMQRDMARRLPAGWTGRVTAGNDGGYDVWLRHSGDAKAAILSMQANDVVDINKPAMLTLLPEGATRDTDFLFHLTDTSGDGDLIRAAAGPHHPGRTPVLLLASKEFMKAQISMAGPVTVPPFTVGGPAAG